MYNQQDSSDSKGANEQDASRVHNDSSAHNDTVDMVSNTPEVTSVSTKKGRPRKSDIKAKQRGFIAKRGRPPGEAAAMAEFKARLINSPKSKKVLESIFNAALDDEHKNQAAAWKIITDRLIPVSSFEKSSGNKPAITINISGLNDASISASSEDVIEGEYGEED